jgi:hypothetical protein
MDRSLDLLIAEHIFGIKKVYHQDWDKENCGLEYIPSGKPWRTHRIDAQMLPRFSTDPISAYTVIEYAMTKYHWLIKSPFTKDGHWFVGLTPLGVTGWNGIPDFVGTGDTMMLAVSKAILATLGLDALNNKIKIIETSK